MSPAVIGKILFKSILSTSTSTQPKSIKNTSTKYLLLGEGYIEMHKYVWQCCHN